MDDYRGVFIDLKASKRSHDSVFFNPGEDRVLGINEFSGVVDEAEQLRESVETFKQNI